MTTCFQPVTDLLIGQVVEVAGTTLKVELSGDVMELTRTYEGRVYPIGQIGSVVKVHFGRRIVFGFVTLLRMRSQDVEVGEAPVPPDADQRLMEIELFAEGLWDQGKQQLRYRRGVSTYPLPRQGVYLLTRDEASELYGAAEGQRPDSGADPLVPFATYVGADNARCRAHIDKMFGMHCAILGSTGSGKSGAVAAVLHAVLDHKGENENVCRPKIIVIDPHGEYGAAFGERGIVYRAYDPIGTEDTKGQEIRLPYWLMTADEFRNLVIGKTEHEATSQHNVIYKALTHARMVHKGLVDPAPTDYTSQDPPTDGTALDEPCPSKDHTLADLADFDRDKPIPFSLDEVVNHITYLQAAREVKGKVEQVTATDFSSKFKSILDKLRVLRLDLRIRFLMDNWSDNTPTLQSVLEQLVGPPVDGKKDLRIIDISGLPNEVAGPLTAMIARLLFQYKLYQSQDERRRDPVLLVCEEAHRYVPDRGEAQYAAAQDAVRRIAREGRKYGLGLMLVSQRPSDIESTVIAQCGTWLVLRLTNSADQAHVARFLPDGLSGMTRALPALAQQEALFVGEGAAVPARVRIHDLPADRLPKSNTVSFASGWAGEGLDTGQIGEIAARMDGSAPTPTTS
jgi:DNA helicase HerA-like ATPase